MKIKRTHAAFVITILLLGLAMPFCVNQAQADTQTTATLTIGDAVGGTVNQQTQTDTIGTMVITTATPTSGYSFLYWQTSWGSQIPDNPLAIIVCKDKTITPVFQQLTLT